MQRDSTPSDDREVGKIGLFAVVLALFASARCYSSDPETVVAGIPIVGAIVSPATSAPAYVKTIGAASQSLPDGDLSKWFEAPESGDPYDGATWSAIDQFLAHATNAANWAVACKKAGEAAGSERSGNAKLGALA